MRNRLLTRVRVRDPLFVALFLFINNDNQTLRPERLTRNSSLRQIPSVVMVGRNAGILTFNLNGWAIFFPGLYGEFLNM